VGNDVSGKLFIAIKLDASLGLIAIASRFVLFAFGDRLMARLISEHVSISDCLPECVHDARRVDFMLCRFVHSHLTRTTR